MTVLAVVPTSREFEALTDHLVEWGHVAGERRTGRLSVKDSGGRLLVAPGGLGRVQFGLHTQHLLDDLANVKLVVCAGTAGGLSPEVVVGDVVVAETTIEHDFNSRPRERPSCRKPGEPCLSAGLVDTDRVGLFDLELL